MSKPVVSLGDKLLLSIDEVSAVLGIGRDLVYKLVLEPEPMSKKPRLYSVRIGRRRLVPKRGLEIFIDNFFDGGI
jgi:excisionase family DNA binding protein